MSGRCGQYQVASPLSDDYAIAYQKKKKKGDDYAVDLRLRF